jgi:UDPglucose--hexose-1-phosphate uridylyltransferase
MTQSADDAPRRIVDPTTGRPILMAPRRQQRPMHTGPGGGAHVCPFCPGHEAETPPAVQAFAAGGRPVAGDGPGWLARAFPNKFPAAELHEVIAEGSVHHEQPGDLDAATWRTCIELWLARIAAVEARPDVRCAFFFKNVGAAAGASIAHNHSQLLGLPELPPRLQLELAVARRAAECPWCTTVATAAADGRILCATADHVVLAPNPPRLPNEIWLLPTRCCDELLSTDLESLAHLFHGLFVALSHGLGRPAFNLWLHRVPGTPFHWHFEIQPRTGQMAGLELGGDMYINSLPPAVTLRRLREGLDKAGWR